MRITAQRWRSVTGLEVGFWYGFKMCIFHHGVPWCSVMNTGSIELITIKGGGTVKRRTMEIFEWLFNLRAGLTRGSWFSQEMSGSCGEEMEKEFCKWDWSLKWQRERPKLFRFFRQCQREGLLLKCMTLSWKNRKFFPCTQPNCEMQNYQTIGAIKAKNVVYWALLWEHLRAVERISKDTTRTFILWLMICWKSVFDSKVAPNQCNSC